MTKVIFIDLDGTFVDLYGVDNWLSKLRSFDASPYREAKKLQIHHQLIEKELMRLKHLGYEIKILSALAKISSPSYDKMVMEAKTQWIEENFSIEFDEILFIPYDSPKELYGDKNDILIDDSEDIRNRWRGIAFDEKAVLQSLKTITKPHP